MLRQRKRHTLLRVVLIHTYVLRIHVNLTPNNVTTPGCVGNRQTHDRRDNNGGNVRLLESKTTHMTGLLWTEPHTAAYCFSLLAARSHLCERVENKGLLSATGVEAEGLVHHHTRRLAPGRRWTRMPPVLVKQHLGHLSHVAVQCELDRIIKYRITEYS